jgi:dihydrolipoamide dehydrogenase
MLSAKRANITITTGARVMEIRETEEKNALVTYGVNDTEKTIQADLVLEAVGRVPDFSSLSIEKTGIALSKNSAINVDDHMRTNVEGIYAIGDCTNTMQLAHIASHQAVVAVDNILKKDHKMDYNFVPSVVFTAPEIATVGKNEKSMIDAGIPYQVRKIPYGSNGKALILNQPLGFVKVIRELETNKLIGATVYGADANALIATLTVALQNNLSTEDLKKTIFAHPTLSELIHEAAFSLDGEAIHTLD